MTQPPGPYGAPYGEPTPYGQPVPVGQPVPSYGRPGPYGPPPQPPSKSLLPWLIVAGAVLVSGFGIALVLLLSGGDSGSREQAAATTSSGAPATSSATPSRESSLGDLPGGAQVAGTESTPSAGNAFPGSDQVALTWVDAMADGDWQTAYDLSCAEVRDVAVTAAAGGDPAYELGRYFYEQTLSGVGFTEGTFDSIQYDETTGTDIGAFTLAMDNGETFTLLVYVGPDLTVCDFR